MESSTLFISVSVQMCRIDDEIRLAARSDAKILLTGETGVGKEVVARLVHRYSRRSGRPFVAINCAGVPDSLLESELFGHVRGSFTGAYRDKAGLFEQAHGGTIFMDEVGEMSLRMQAMLLRFLEDGDIHRVGADRRTRTVDVRVVAATNRVLPDRIAAGAFREDLYHRLNVVHLAIPPLRDRRDDIAPLLRHFLQTFSAKYGVPVPVLAPEVMDLLQRYDWPGNVRELKNAAERLIVRGGGDQVTLADLPSVIPGRALRLVGPDAIAATATVTGQPLAGAVAMRAALGRPTPLALFDRIVSRRESFWSAVYSPFMTRDLTRDDVRTIVTAGLQQTRGNYKLLLELFNMKPADYKRFMNFLAKHGCHLPFQQFRVNAGSLRAVSEEGTARNERRYKHVTH